MTKQILVLATLTMVTFSSCNNEDDFSIFVPRGEYQSGLLISHEGNFEQGNASVAYVDNNLQTVEKTIFSNVNGQPLGDTAQSMAFNGDFAYIILNVSNKIEVVDRYTFESVATIDTGLSNPRYMTFSNGKGYVTNWGDFTPDTDDYLAVIDLDENSVLSTIPTSYLPEEIIAFGNRIYVATGIFGMGNTVDVINTISDEVETSITVGTSPNSLQFDNSGDLWVLSSENLVEINTTSNQIVKTIDFPDTISSSSDLNYDNTSLYFYAEGSVYRIAQSSLEFPSETVLDNVNYYDMRVSNGFIFGLDAGDFTNEGTLSVYSLIDDSEIANLSLDIAPGEVYFN